MAKHGKAWQSKGNFSFQTNKQTEEKCVFAVKKIYECLGYTILNFTLYRLQEDPGQARLETPEFSDLIDYGTMVTRCTNGRERRHYAWQFNSQFPL